MKQFRDLLESWSDGVISEAELQELDTYLEEPEKRKILVQDFTDRALLSTVIREEALSKNSTFHDPAPVRFFPIKALLSAFRNFQFPSLASARGLGLAMAALVVCALVSTVALRAFHRSDLPHFTIVSAARVTNTGLLRKVTAHSDLLPGDNIQTVPGRPAVLDYNDGTHVELTGTAELRIIGGPGKKLELLSGTMSVAAAKQPAGRPMEITTPDARAVVVGTRFNLTVALGSTWLAVEEGRVNFLSGPNDSRSVSVGAREYSVAAEDVDPSPRAFASLDSISSAPLLVDWSLKSMKGDGSWRIQNGELEQGKVTTRPAWPVLWSEPKDPTSRVDLPASIRGDCLFECSAEVNAVPGDVPPLSKWAGFAIRLGITDRLVKLYFIDNGEKGKLLFSLTRTEPPQAGAELITTPCTQFVPASYHIKLLIRRGPEGTMEASGKVWKVGDEEPAAWLVETEMPIGEAITRFGLETTHCACTFRDFKASLLK